MPDPDPFTLLQLLGLAATWLAAVGAWFWRIKVSTGTDRDMFLMIALVGGCVFLTLIQFIALMARLG